MDDNEKIITESKDLEKSHKSNEVEINIIVNGMQHCLSVPTNLTLLELLREHLGLSGTKNGCNSSHCGACTVLLNGKAVYACSVLAVQAHDQCVTTIKGIGNVKSIHAIQEAFVSSGAIQCGFCTPGMIMAAKDLLDHNKYPSNFEIKDALSGNLCRCTGYTKIVEAVHLASELLEAVNK